MTRRGWDSNPRPLSESLVFKTSSLNHSDTSPYGFLQLRLSSETFAIVQHIEMLVNTFFHFISSFFVLLPLSAGSKHTISYYLKSVNTFLQKFFIFFKISLQSLFFQQFFILFLSVICYNIIKFIHKKGSFLSCIKQ